MGFILSSSNGKIEASFRSRLTVGQWALNPFIFVRIEAPELEYNNYMTAKKYWSGYVTKHSIALDLEEGVFTWDDPRRIASSLKQSAENSLRRKAPPFQSAMSMLNFYINRAGRNLKPERKKILEQAKVELQRLFNRE